MTPERKARVALVLGVVCLAVGVLNLAIVGVRALRNQAPAGSGLFASGIGAMTVGIIMIAVGKKKPGSTEEDRSEGW